MEIFRPLEVHGVKKGSEPLNQDIQTSNSDFSEIANLGSISRKLYAQLLRAKIPKAQKRKSSHQCLFALMGSVRVKGAHKMLVKLTPEGLPSLPATVAEQQF